MLTLRGVLLSSANLKPGRVGWTPMVWGTFNPFHCHSRDKPSRTLGKSPNVLHCKCACNPLSLSPKFGVICLTNGQYFTPGRMIAWRERNYQMPPIKISGKSASSQHDLESPRSHDRSHDITTHRKWRKQNCPFYERWGNDVKKSEFTRTFVNILSKGN